MGTVIVPTVGRIVWVWRKSKDKQLQPEAALVTYVHNERMINAAGFDAVGKPFALGSVRLIQEGDPVVDGSGPYAEWMPYQLGQAKRETPAQSLPPATNPAGKPGPTAPAPGAKPAGPPAGTSNPSPKK